MRALIRLLVIVTMVMSLFFIVSSPAPGQQTQQAPYRLDDVVVTAERIQSPLREAPANVTIISREEIESEGAQTLADLLQKEPGVFTRSPLGNPKASTVDIRGYGETAPANVLFLIDGRRVNSIDLSGPDLAQIPLEIIERVEVYRGPASVLYGDNALAGVVNIITRKGEGKPTLSTSVTAGSYNYFKPQASILGKQDKLSYFALGSYTDTDGYRHNNTFRSKDLFTDLGYELGKNLDLSLRVGLHNDSYGQPGALLWKGQLNSGLYDRKDSVTPNDKASTEDNFADFEAVFKLDNLVKLYLGGSFRDRHTSSSFDYGSGSFTDNMSSLQTYGFTPKLVFETPASTIKNMLVVGFDYYRYPTTVNVYGDSFLGASNTSTSVERTDTALYVNDKLYPIPELLLEAGYRTQQVKYDVRHTDYVNPAVNASSSTNEEKDAYRLAANYSFSSAGSVFASYAKGFRFPLTEEFVVPGYCFFGFCVPTVVNDDLKPQTGEEFNIGLRWNPFKVVGGSLTYFRAKNVNEIFFNPVTFTNENFDRTKREGIETNLLFNLTQMFSLGVSYSYTQARFDGGPFDGNDIPLVPNNKFSSTLTFTHGNWMANLIGLYTGPRWVASDTDNAQRKLPGFTVFDASVGYRFKALNALLTVKNLFGKKYYDTGTYSTFRNDIGVFPAPVQQFFFRLEYSLGG
jgi:iron complex outermembrane recepter protein